MIAGQIPLRPKHSRKFVQGEKFASILELYDWIKAGRWVFIRDKVYHPAWVMNMNLSMLIHANVLRAELSQAWKEEVERMLRNYE